MARGRNTSIRRDPASQALLATDTDKLAAYRAARTKRQQAANLEEDINSIMQRIKRIEQHLGFTE